METTKQRSSTSNKTKNLPKSQNTGVPWGGLLLLGLGIGGALALANEPTPEYLYPTPDPKYKFLYSEYVFGGMENMMYYDHNVIRRYNLPIWDEYLETVSSAWSHIYGKNYAEALRRFEEHMIVFPNWSTLWNIGICHVKLGDTTRARATYRQFINEAPTDLIQKINRVSLAIEIERIVGPLFKT
jgi:TolA-binding protein